MQDRDRAHHPHADMQDIWKMENPDIPSKAAATVLVRSWRRAVVPFMQYPPNELEQQACVADFEPARTLSP